MSLPPSSSSLRALLALAQDASLSACISLGSMVAAGGLAALSASILPGISHTQTHTHTSFTACSQTGFAICVPRVVATTGGEGHKEEKDQGGLEVGVGTWALRQPDAAN